MCAQVEMAEECKAGDATGTYFQQFTKIIIVNTIARTVYVYHTYRRARSSNTFVQFEKRWVSTSTVEHGVVFFFCETKYRILYSFRYRRTLTGINMSRIILRREFECLRCGFFCCFRCCRSKMISRLHFAVRA